MAEGVGHTRKDQVMKRKLGRHVIVDSQIFHGQPTFRGTRILVNDVLEQVAQGMAWDSIQEQWRGAISHAAISEAVRLAGKAISHRCIAHSLLV